MTPQQISEWVDNSNQRRAEPVKTRLILHILDMLEAIALMRNRTPDDMVYLYLPRQIFGLTKKELVLIYFNVRAHYNSRLHWSYIHNSELHWRYIHQSEGNQS